MHEIQIKTITSQNHKRKKLCIVEYIDKNGFLAKAEKIYSYYVQEQRSLPDKIEPDKDGSPAKINGNEYQKRDRHVSVKKFFDRKSGIGQMIYRVIGSFYVVNNLRVFAVVFMHTIKFDVIVSNPSKVS